MRVLYVIPARGGSKGIPRKNIKMLAGKPLIHYTIEVARALAPDEDICVSTDDRDIKSIVEESGLSVPFLRPSYLASDSAGTYEVLLHALSYYKEKGRIYDLLVLLQPTSPLRRKEQVKEAIDLWEKGIEMIVSVKETKANPYYVLCEENALGYLEKSKPANFIRRQDCPPVYEYNGAIYVIDVECLQAASFSTFKKIKKYIMDEATSIDIDTPFDWQLAECLMTSNTTDSI